MTAAEIEALAKGATLRAVADRMIPANEGGVTALILVQSERRALLALVNSLPEICAATVARERLEAGIRFHEHRGTCKTCIMGKECAIGATLHSERNRLMTKYENYRASKEPRK